jgi:hypothetical protein
MAAKVVRAFSMSEWAYQQVLRRSKGERGTKAVYSASAVLNRMVERYCEIVRLGAPKLTQDALDYLARVPTDGTLLGLARTLLLLSDSGDAMASAILSAIGHDHLAMVSALDWIEQQTGGADAAKSQARRRTSKRAAAKWLAKPHRRAGNREPRPTAR